MYMVVMHCAVRMAMMMVVMMMRCRRRRTWIDHGSKGRAIFAMMVMAVCVLVIYSINRTRANLLVAFTTMVVFSALHTFTMRSPIHHYCLTNVLTIFEIIFVAFASLPFSIS